MGYDIPSPYGNGLPPTSIDKLNFGGSEGPLGQAANAPAGYAQPANDKITTGAEKVAVPLVHKWSELKNLGTKVDMEEQQAVGDLAKVKHSVHLADENPYWLNSDQTSELAHFGGIADGYAGATGELSGHPGYRDIFSP
jgi:hypothetical protein